MKFASGALEVTAAPEGFAKSVMDAVGRHPRAPPFGGRET